MRSVAEVSKDIAAYAPTGGDTWQNVGMRQVPVRLLTELRDAVERERRVKVRWQAQEPSELWEWASPETWRAAKAVCVYAGAWRFDG